MHCIVDDNTCWLTVEAKDHNKDFKFANIFETMKWIGTVYKIVSNIDGYFILKLEICQKKIY